MRKQASLDLRNFAVNFAIAFLLAGAFLMPVQSAMADEERDNTSGIDVASIAEVTPFEAINYYLARHFSAYSVAVTGFLNPEVQLPVTVEIAVPAGSEIIWFSEFSGGPVANDPQIPEPLNVRTEGNLDIYTAVLQNYHAIQIEYHIDHEPTTRLSEGMYSVSMEYTLIADVPYFRFMTNLPAESIVQDANVEFMGADAEGYLVFMRLFTDVSAHTTMQGEITFMPPEGQGMIDEGVSLLGGIGTTVAMIAVAIAAVLAFLFVTARRQREEE